MVAQGQPVAQRQPVLFPEEVINKLKSMQIESWHAKSSTSYMGKGNYRRDNLEELHLSRLTSNDIVYSFLHSNPNLKSLSLIDCSFKELVPFESLPQIGVVPKLKVLKLIDLPYLENIGFENDIVLQRIEILILKDCPYLVTIVPSSVSLIHLTSLEVVNCKTLRNLLSPSTAKSLCQLRTMKVIKCESLTEIVSAQENEENAIEVVIVFKQLRALELVSLKNLKSFCNSKNCSFEFSSLEKLVVSACSKMENFSEKVQTTPILQKIYVIHEKEKKKWYWYGTLRATIQTMFKEKNFFESMDELSFSDHLELQEAWCRKLDLQNNWFYSLKTLKLENCNEIQYAIPSHILCYLKSLIELEVRRCCNVEAIFDMNGIEFMGTAFQLKKLTLRKLPKLNHVWENHHQGILCFQNLQQIIVSHSEKLKSLFPVSLAKNLKKLEALQIGNCVVLQEIVEKEDVGEPVTFVFPRLTFLHLSFLESLTSFYPKTFTLGCPFLNHLSVSRCGKLELFHNQQPHPVGDVSSTSINRPPLSLDLKFKNQQESHHVGEGSSTSINKQPLFSDPIQFQNQQEPHPVGEGSTTSINRQPLFSYRMQEPHLVGEGSSTSITTQLPFSNLKTIANLEKLWLDWNHTSGLMLRLGQFTEGFKYLKKLSLSLGSQKDEITSLIREILKKALHLETMSIYYYSGLKISWPGAFCENLCGLYVYKCPHLTTLVPSEVFFFYLKELEISECHGLKYLFTSSVANKLKHLEEIRVEGCTSMETIVKKEKNESSEDTNFEQLNWISLSSLSSLECFYSGKDTLLVPSLIQVNISQCPKMKFFSQGSIQHEAKSFRGIQTASDSDDDLVLHEDPNLSVEVVFLQQQVNIVLEGSPLVLKIWNEVKPVVPDRCFGSLNSLVVEGCEFLSKGVVLPSHLLCSLNNLRVLQVRKCNSVQAVFDHTTDLVSIPLRKLILEQLPNLEHVWNGGNQGSLNLPHLEEVLVDGCENIESLFPASMANDELRILEVENCVRLVEIVAKDEVATEVNPERIIFQSLTLLRLWKLPKLRCIYPGMLIPKWPKLQELDVLHCQVLRFFATEVKNSPDSHLEDQNSFPTDQQESVSLKKVTPHLENLCLGKEEAMMIKQGKLHIDLQLGLVKLQSFIDESDVFPFVFVSNEAVPQPSIEKIEVVDSAFEKIFPSQKPDINFPNILSQPKGLKLQNLPRLNSIGLEHNWMNPILENLETLYVWECKCLTILIPSVVFFSNLKALNIKDCHGLNYVFTSSTARNLGVLKEMHVSNCQSIKEIFETEEGDGPNVHMIIFEQLQVLTLSSLPALENFYSGSSTLNFPSLKQVAVNVCYRMKFFCNHYQVPEKLEVLKDGFDTGHDLNSVIKEQSDDASSGMTDSDDFYYDMVENY